jgi:cyclic pyranopterin phosphate synthase
MCPPRDVTPGLTHLDARGQAHMVGVADKPETHRGAIARSSVRLSALAFERVRDASGPKGDAIAVARLAGLQGAKKTADLIPLCHPLRIVRIEVDATLDEANLRVHFEVRVEAVDRTGVEMEAMTGAAIAALALYDMVKSVDRHAFVESVQVLEKWGGRSGHLRTVGP